MNNYCHVSNQVAIHCDVDERCLSEILAELCENEVAYINGEEVELNEVTDSIDVEEMREAVQHSVQGNSLVIYELYIKALKDFI